MNLIAYSDSEGSDDGADVAQPTPVHTAPKSVQKIVDRANPGRIKLQLPGAAPPQIDKDEYQEDAPPTKRARTGGGGAFGGFNAMLPAPKKPKIDPTVESGNAGKRGLGKGLGIGVNLKTGAEPAFRRERILEKSEVDANGAPIRKEPLEREDFRALLNLPAPAVKPAGQSTPAESQSAEPETSEVVSAKPKFMPMSVARGKKTKKPLAKAIMSSDAGNVAHDPRVRKSDITETTAAPAKPKVSLFSVGAAAIEGPKPINGDYEPLLSAQEGHDEAESDIVMLDDSTAQPSAHETSATQSAVPNHLAGIASELNLTEAERRQLFGRKNVANDNSSPRIMEFNTDAEYAHNEFLRAQGETVQHNALRSITGTGKNNLRSLINVATTQKDALEDHFAQGRRNKREAGNKYG